MENPMDSRAWRASPQGRKESDTTEACTQTLDLVDGNVDNHRRASYIS